MRMDQLHVLFMESIEEGQLNISRERRILLEQRGVILRAASCRLRLCFLVKRQLVTP